MTLVFENSPANLARLLAALTELAGTTVRVLNLEAVIESKEALGREKDRAALPLLRETLRLKRLRDRS